jgi:hypothetical protein
MFFFFFIKKKRKKNKQMTTLGDNYPLYCNSTGAVTVSGPWINNSGTATTSANQTNSVNQMSGFVIFDNSTSAPSNTQPYFYFRAVATFMLLSGVLDSAPASTVVQSSSTVSQVPNVVMSISGLSANTQYFFIILSLTAGGKTAMTPVFQTVTDSSSLVFILSNYFQISVPGLIYTVSCEAYAMQNASLF